MHKICIVGVGFLGGHFNEAMCRAIFSQDIMAEVVHIDDDCFESRNAGNQNINLLEGEAETPKVAIAGRVTRGFGLKATGHQTRLDMSNMLDLLEGATLIVDAVDNIPTRQLLSLASKALKIPVLHMGISKKGTGRIDWSSPEFTNFPYTPEAVAGRNLKDDDGGGEPPCEMFAHLGNGMNVVNAATKAFCLFMGKDPWKQTSYLVGKAIEATDLDPEQKQELKLDYISEIGDGLEQKGLMTSWDTWPTGLTVRADELSLVDGFYPIIEMEN